MVPPWVPEVPLPDAPPGDAPAEGDGAVPAPATAPVTPPATAAPMAPTGRFTGTRRALKQFASTGDARGMKRAVAHYVRSGYGGSGTATRRFGGAAGTAATLYGALSSSGREAVTLPGGLLDVAALAGRSADETMNAVVEAVRPIDGTQDAEASRAAVRDALSELLTRYPDATLLELTDDQRLFAVERYLAHDVYRRFSLDVGKVILGKAPTAPAGLARLKEVKDYIKETVSAAFKRVRAAATLGQQKISQLASSALKEAFTVFESYSQ